MGVKVVVEERNGPSDPCDACNNEKVRFSEPWKYEVTKDALCAGIDVA